MYFRYRVAFCVLLAAGTAILLGNTERSLSCQRIAQQVNCQIHQSSYSGLTQTTTLIRDVQKVGVQSEPFTGRGHRPGELLYKFLLESGSETVELATVTALPQTGIPEPPEVTAVEAFLKSSQPSMEYTLAQYNAGVVIAVLLIAFSLTGRNGKGLIIGWK